MIINRYILTNVRTGETIIGTREELELIGYDGEWLSDAAHRKYMINKEWKCSVYDKVQKPKKQDKKAKEKKLSIDDIQKLAMAAGMNYGQYVALHNL